MKGKQKRVKVFNQNGKLIKTYETIISASNAHFPNRYAEYLNDAFKRTNGVFTFDGLTFVKSETGISQNYRRYYIKDKHADKTFIVIGTNEVLKLILNGHNNFFRQFKKYGNYDDTRYTIWRIN